MHDIHVSNHDQLTHNLLVSDHGQDEHVECLCGPAKHGQPAILLQTAAMWHNDSVDGAALTVHRAVVVTHL